MKNVLKDFVHQLDIMNTISGGTSATSVDIDKNDKYISINISSPSVNSEAFNIFVRGEQLVVYSVVKAEENSWIMNEEKTASTHMIPMFNQVFDMPPFVVKEEIEAVFENGSLKVILPLQEPESIPVKRIDIREY